MKSLLIFFSFHATFKFALLLTIDGILEFFIKYIINLLFLSWTYGLRPILCCFWSGSDVFQFVTSTKMSEISQFIMLATQITNWCCLETLMGEPFWKTPIYKKKITSHPIITEWVTSIFWKKLIYFTIEKKNLITTL